MDREPDYGPGDIAQGADTSGPIERVLITGANDLDDMARWDTDPRFEFATEVDAIQVLDLLGEQARSLRRQLAHTMRYATLAAQSAHRGDVAMSKNAIIHHSRLARQTVLDMFKDDPE